MRYVYNLIEIGDVLALVSVLVLLLRGPSRKFWALLVYVAWELLTNLALGSFDLIYNLGMAGSSAPANVVRWYVPSGSGAWLRDESTPRGPARSRDPRNDSVSQRPCIDSIRRFAKWGSI